MRLNAARLMIAALLLPAGGARAGLNNTGSNGMEFLAIGPGGRPLGMGEAYGPVAEGAESVYWNPAGMAQLKRPEFFYGRTEFYRLFHHDYAAYAHPTIWGGAFGASFTHFSQDRIEAVSNVNIPLGQSFAPYSDAFALAYAQSFKLGQETVERNREYFAETWYIPRVNRPLSIENEPWTGTLLAGFSAKIVNETIYKRRAYAWAFDGGVIFRPAGLSRLSLSAAFRNLGTTSRFNVEDEHPPLELNVGAAYDWRLRSARLLPVFEVGIPYYGPPFGKLGVEYSRPVTRRVMGAVRLGYNSRSAADLNALNGLTAGVGARYRALNVDFGFQPAAQLGEVYRMSLGVRW